MKFLIRIFFIIAIALVSVTKMSAQQPDTIAKKQQIL